MIQLEVDCDVGVLHPKTIESPLEIHKRGYYSAGIRGEQAVNRSLVRTQPVSWASGQSRPPSGLAEH